jgi:hypothetical protein
MASNRVPVWLRRLLTLCSRGLDVRDRVIGQQRKNREMLATAPARQREQEQESKTLLDHVREAAEFSPTIRGTREEINRQKVTTVSEWSKLRKRAG